MCHNVSSPYQNQGYEKQFLYLMTVSGFHITPYFEDEKRFDIFTDKHMLCFCSRIT